MMFLSMALVAWTAAVPYSAPSVGPLPASPVTRIDTVTQELIAITSEGVPRGAVQNNGRTAGLATVTQRAYA